MLTIAIWITVLLGLGCIAMMLGFGLSKFSRMAGEGKLVLVAFFLPIVIWVIAYFLLGSWEGAAILTAVVLALICLAALVYSGARSLAR